MTRRAALPGAAELFRTTVRSSQPTSSASSSEREVLSATTTGPLSTGRRKHDSKITVYVSDEELLVLEQARLALRAQHGIAVDRGRLVRESVAVLLADLDARGENSVLVQRLRQEPEE